MCKFRDLKANEIETRAQSISEKGLQLLLYKDARVDMNILDETVGASNWQREHYECKGNLFCRVGINVNFDNEKEPLWIWKSDCGAESNTEAQKGEASDSFKRACVNWGIGRELYSAPFIWIKAADFDLKEYVVKNEKKYKTYDKFSVSDITISNGIIEKIRIKNDSNGKIVYTYGYTNQSTPPSTPQVPFPEALMTYEKALEYKLVGGKYRGMTVAEAFKKDIKYFYPVNEPLPTKDIEAINLVKAGIAAKNAQK